MDLDKRVSNLEILLAEQQKIIDSQQIKLRQTRNKLINLNLKLLEIQSSVISQEVKPKVLPVEILNNKNSDVAVYSFGGMATELNMPPAEFMRSLESFDIEQVFFKDFFQCWYHKGLLGYADNLVETIEWLKDFKKEKGHKKVITIGTSAGGYAAIVFGAAIKASKILAFSPQTHLKKEFFDRFPNLIFDWRYFNNKVLNRDFINLNTFLNHQDEIPPIEIYFGEQCLPDKIEVENINIGKHKEVSIHPVKDTDSHGIAGILKDRGELSQILQNAISEII